MPTYEYACSNCKNEWEEIQKISEDPIKVCPKCAQETAKRQISGGNFILKGGGWYADLYSSSSNKKAGGDSGSSSGAGGSSGGSGGDSSTSKPSTPATTPSTPAPAPKKETAPAAKSA